MASKHGRVRGKVEIELTQFYGLSGKKPRLGSEILLDLAIGENGAKVTTPPTLAALATHFGFYDSIVNRMRLSLAQGMQLEQWEITALEQYQRTRLDEKFIKPIREYYRKVLYFYCVPPPLLIEKDIETGQMMEEMMVSIGGLAKKGKFLVLSVLPVDASDAKDYFGLTRQRLEDLAPQTCWLVLRLIALRVIRSRQDAETRLNGWLPYLTKHTHELINERVRGYLT